MQDEQEQKERARRVAMRLEPDAAIKTNLLQCFPYEFAPDPVEISTTTNEFSSVCPMTGLPDYGTLTIVYVPDEWVVELKSLKYYLLQYREVGIYYEHLVNRIRKDLVEALKPKSLTIRGEFSARGGLQTTVVSQFGDTGGTINEPGI